MTHHNDQLCILVKQAVRDPALVLQPEGTAILRQQPPGVGGSTSTPPQPSSPCDLSGFHMNRRPQAIRLAILLATIIMVGRALSVPNPAAAIDRDAAASEL